MHQAGFPPGTRTTVDSSRCRRERVTSGRPIPPADGGSVAGVAGDDGRRNDDGEGRGVTALTRVRSESDDSGVDGNVGTIDGFWHRS